MSRNKKIGQLGESIAKGFIQNLGYEIIAINWTIGHKEIDIIALDEGIYIFVEVKTRTTLSQGMPEESVSQSKINHVTEAARQFLYDKEYKDIRFDVISIHLKSENDYELLHIQDAFY